MVMMIADNKGVEKTAKQWAEELEHSTSCNFLSYRRKVISSGDHEAAFYSKEDREKYSARKREERVAKYLDSKTGLSLTATEWAKKIGVTATNFNLRVRKYGPSSLMIFMSTAELLTITTTVQKASKPSCEFVAAGKRRIPTVLTLGGSWESKHIPDRFKHLDKEFG